MGITFSSNTETIQLFLKSHCIGLIWRQPRWTCFSVAVSNSIWDISCQTRQVSLESNFCIFAMKVYQCSRVDLFGGPILIFPYLPSNPAPDTALLEFVYAGDKFGGIWLCLTSCLGTGRFLYPV